MVAHDTYRFHVYVLETCAEAAPFLQQLDGHRGVLASRMTRPLFVEALSGDAMNDAARMFGSNSPVFLTTPSKQVYQGGPSIIDFLVTDATSAPAKAFGSSFTQRTPPPGMLPPRIAADEQAQLIGGSGPTQEDARDAKSTLKTPSFYERGPDTPEASNRSQLRDDTSAPAASGLDPRVRAQIEATDFTPRGGGSASNRLMQRAKEATSSFAQTAGRINVSDTKIGESVSDYFSAVR